MDKKVITCLWEEGIRGLNGNGKNTIKIKFKKLLKMMKRINLSRIYNNFKHACN